MVIVTIRGHEIDYDPETDTRGDIGIKLADTWFRENRYDFSRLGELSHSSSFASEESALVKIAQRKLVRKSSGAPTVESMHELLRDLRSAGYPLESYSGLDRRELWDYVNQVRKDILSSERRLTI